MIGCDSLSREGWKKLPRIELIPIPEDVKVPKDIPASKVRIPSTYTGHDVEYEDDEGKPVDENEATHLRFTGIDRRSDIVIGPMKPKGMIKLNLYLNDDEIPVVKEQASHVKSKILSESYRPLRS
ncbi:hypothetical protein [Methanobacterium sp.]|uniref:hypothetical protein n=1 Tax=Methanobacterium sp. TaxID=2164 RepID=UPI003C731B99